MARFKDVEWDIKTAGRNANSAADCHEARLAVLMDIRDELKKLNALLGCPNFTGIPAMLRRIGRNTTRRRRKA